MFLNYHHLGAFSQQMIKKTTIIIQLIKAIVHPKMNTKVDILKNVGNQTITGPHWLSLYFFSIQFFHTTGTSNSGYPQTIPLIYKKK